MSELVRNDTIYAPGRLLSLFEASSFEKSAFFAVHPPNMSLPPSWFKNSAVNLNLCSPDDVSLRTERRTPQRPTAVVGVAENHAKSYGE